MVQEFEYDDKYKIVRFYIDYLPFEILTEKENDSQLTAEWRRLELKKDYEQYGDYLHSHQFVEKIKQENITE